MPLPSGWEQSDPSCSGYVQGREPEETQAEVYTDIKLDKDEVVTCVFTTTAPGQIVVQVQTSPSDLPAGVDIGATWLDSDETLTLRGGSIHDSGPVNTGPYSVWRVGALPEGWSNEAVTCTSSSAPGATEDPAAIVLEHGELVTCEFAYTGPPRIALDVVTAPSSDPQPFEFDASWLSDTFTLTDDGEVLVWDGLAEGVPHSLSGSLPSADWQQDVTCTSSSAPGATEDPAAIVLDPGELVACVFTYTGPARLTLDVVTAPSADPQPFEFDASWLSDTFTLTDDGEVLVWDGLAEGVPHSLSGSLPSADWQQDATCTSKVLVNGEVTEAPEDPAAIVLDAGELVECVFTYTGPPRVSWSTWSPSHPATRSHSRSSRAATPSP